MKDILNKSNHPIVNISSLSFSGSGYESGDRKWDATNLVEWCKEQKYKVFDFPLAAVNLNTMPFRVATLDDFIWQLKRVMETDLKYPIIFDEKGVICDGWHRVTKALYEKKSTIKAIRIEKMPEPSGYVKEKSE